MALVEHCGQLISGVNFKLKKQINASLLQFCSEFIGTVKSEDMWQRKLFALLKAENFDKYEVYMDAVLVLGFSNVSFCPMDK